MSLILKLMSMCRSLQAGAVGVDLTAASEAIFVELPKDVSQLRQAEARIHRKVEIMLKSFDP